MRKGLDKQPRMFYTFLMADRRSNKFPPCQPWSACKGESFLRLAPSDAARSPIKIVPIFDRAIRAFPEMLSEIPGYEADSRPGPMGENSNETGADLFRSSGPRAFAATA